VNHFTFEPQPVTGIAISGQAKLFPVRRVYCVGRNYAEHAREMGFSDRDPPFFFCKPGDAVVPVPDGSMATLEYPERTRDFQHEIELVVAIGKAGHDIDPTRALEHAWGYAVGLDMTRRDRQVEMREQGRPWEIGKSFDRSALVGSLRPASAHGHPSTGEIWLEVEGERRQRSDISALIWDVSEVIAHLSTWFALQPGDLVFTGTPAGVGPVLPGQRLVGGIDGLGELRVQIAPRVQQ
jgi:fumarylpyruvate hydrolase